VNVDCVVAKTMYAIVQHCTARRLSAHHVLMACRQYSVSRQIIVDSERARLLTSFYYQGAIDKAANKVWKFYIADFVKFLIM